MVDKVQLKAHNTYIGKQHTLRHTMKHSEFLTNTQLQARSDVRALWAQKLACDMINRNDTRAQLAKFRARRQRVAVLDFVRALCFWAPVCGLIGFACALAIYAVSR